MEQAQGNQADLDDPLTAWLKGLPEHGSSRPDG